jgi:outer membrane protein TolC
MKRHQFRVLSARPVFWTAVLRVSLVWTALAWGAVAGAGMLAGGCAVSAPEGLPPIYKDPNRALFASGAQASAGAVKEAEVSTQWWLEGAPDPLDEARRLARDKDRDVKSPSELLGEGVPIAEADVVRLALAGNVDIRLSDKMRRAAVAEIVARRGQVYDPLLIGRLSESGSDSLPDPSFEEAALDDSLSSGGTGGTGIPSSSERLTQPTIRTENRLGRVGVQQRIFTGGTIELFYQESNTEIDGPGEDSDSEERRAEAGVTLTQPLLRGAGRLVTEQPILTARINREISEEAFRNTLIAQLGDSLRAYYDLIFALENAAVQRISLQQALDLLDINISRERVGDLAIVDVEQARANAAARKEQYLVAIQGIYDTQDRLRRLLNVSQSADIGWDLALLPTDVPAYGSIQASEAEALQAAWANRPDWRQALLSIDLADLNERVGRNALLPLLNLSATTANLGRARGGGEARDQVGQEDYDSYEVALDFSYPLLNRQARYEHLQRKLEKDQAVLRLENLALGILTEIRGRLRSLRTNRLRIDVTNEAVRAERVKYEAELKRYEVGLSTSFQLLEFLEDLSTAKVNNLRAIIDYQKSLVDLEQSRGTLLQRCGITVEAGAIGVGSPDFVQVPPVDAAPIEGLGPLDPLEPGEVYEIPPFAPSETTPLEPFGEILPEGGLDAYGEAFAGPPGAPGGSPDTAGIGATDLGTGAATIGPSSEEDTIGPTGGGSTVAGDGSTGG